LAASLKAERWIKLLEKIDDDAQSDQKHFFSSIAKVRGTKVDSSIDTLYTTPISETDPTPVTTSDPEQIKEVLRSSFKIKQRHMIQVIQSLTLPSLQQFARR
jgi:hypothetical protein